MVPDLSPPPVPFSKSSPSNDPISTADFDGINASVNSSCSTGIGTGSCAEGVMVAMTSSKGRHRRRSWFMHVEGNGIKKQKGNLDNAKQSLGERRHLDIRETTTIIDSKLSSVRPVRISIRNTHLHTNTNTRQRHDIPGSTWSSGYFRFLCGTSMGSISISHALPPTCTTCFRPGTCSPTSRSLSITLNPLAYSRPASTLRPSARPI